MIIKIFLKIKIHTLIILITQSLSILGMPTIARSLAIPIPSQQYISDEPFLLAQTSEPTINVKVIYYPIQGTSAAQLRQQMNQLGPIDPNSGRPYDAYTKWNVSWHYYYKMNNNQCVITSAVVKTIITITLPQWNSPPHASQKLIEKWNKYLLALQNHENVHKQNGIDASYEILSSLNQLGAYSDCKKLESTANNTGYNIIKKYNLQDLNYDQKTGHGKTQGAVFP